MEKMRVYIGYDAREHLAYEVAKASLLRHASIPVEVIPLDVHKLTSQGLITRPVDRRGGIYDLISNASASTDFAITRFLTPLLAQTGFALFVDSDVVFMGDVAELFDLADNSKAVQVVKHEYVSGYAVKMDNQKQLGYPCKNWSSVILFNCNHVANKRLSLNDINHRTGLELHQFYWLHESEIGELPNEWNWLVGEQEKPDNIKIAHFTLGCPCLRSYVKPHDEIWNNELEKI
jgi:hypothetical protein